MIQSASPWAHGRSLRNNRGRVMLPTLDNDTSQESPAAHAWLEAARHEFASIASFGHVSRSLEALGASPDLVERTERAADDERHHTKICLDLAVLAGAQSTRIISDVNSLTGLFRRPDDLVTTARSALLDGVVGEAFVARRLDAVAERTEGLRVPLARMADDERQHAALSADIVRWCVSLRPWVVDQLKVDLGELEARPPIAPEVAATSDSDRRLHGLYLDADAAEAWSSSRADAACFIGAVRSEVAQSTSESTDNFEVSFKTS